MTRARKGGPETRTASPVIPPRLGTGAQQKGNGMFQLLGENECVMDFKLKYCGSEVTLAGGGDP